MQTACSGRNYAGVTFSVINCDDERLTYSITVSSWKTEVKEKYTVYLMYILMFCLVDSLKSENNHDITNASFTQLILTNAM